jgi:hypothetical protein
METGTQIILQRMIDCPEEFPSEGEYHGKWGKIIQDARNYLPKEDIESLDAGYKQLLIDRFNERVLKTLAGEQEETIRYKAKERFSGGFSDPRAFASAVAKGEGQMIDDHLDAHRQAIRQGLIDSIGITTAHKGSSK